MCYKNESVSNITVIIDKKVVDAYLDVPALFEQSGIKRQNRLNQGISK